MRLCQLVPRLLSARLVAPRPLRLVPVLGLLVALLFAAPPPAFAQASGSDTDDEAVLTPAEPDYRVINLPTTLRLPLYKGSFALTHRFNGNLRNDFSDQAAGLFGIDNGAQIGFEYRFAPLRHLELIAYRTNFDRTIQLYTKWDAIHQNSGHPISVSGLLSIEGGDNFSRRYAPSVGATISRQIDDRAALYVVPMWVHNISPLLADITGVKDNTFFIGVGGRLRIRPTVYISAEVTPRVAGTIINTTEYAFAIEKRAGAHLFQLNFGNSQGTTFAQLASGGLPNSLFMGFNITRKFF